MRYMFLLSIVLFAATSDCMGQNPGSTPVPISSKGNSPVKEFKGKTFKNSIRLSAPLLKTNDENQQMIVYLVSNGKDKLEKSKYQLKIYCREKIWGDSPEVLSDENDTTAILIDGRLIKLSGKNSDMSTRESQFASEPRLLTQTLTFDIADEDISQLTRSTSFTVVWNKINAEITPQGLNTLHKFLLDEN